eukprot:767253-Hanusia_phi.AAC.7
MAANFNPESLQEWKKWQRLQGLREDEVRAFCGHGEEGRASVSRAEYVTREGAAEQYVEIYSVFTKKEIFDFWKEFVDYDLDGSGELDSLEIMNLFGKFGEPLSHKAAKAIVTGFAGGKDGIDFEAFLKAMYGIKTGRPMKTCLKWQERARPFLRDAFSSDRLCADLLIVNKGVVSRKPKGARERQQSLRCPQVQLSPYQP